MSGSTTAARCRTASATATRCSGSAARTPTPARSRAPSRAIGAPFTALDVPGQAARDVYGRDLLLVRPDLHVVWRGNRPPDDPAQLAAIATGHRLD